MEHPKFSGELRVEDELTPEMLKAESPASVWKLIGTAIVLFGAWQLIYHWIFMVAFPLRGMLAFHSVDWMMGATGAALLTAYFIRILRRQNKQLQTLDWQKSLLVNAIVHDLRQPLSVMMMSLQQMRNESSLSAGAGKLLAIAHSSSSKLMEMVGDLLEAARLEANRPLVDLREIPPAEFIREGSKLLESLAVVNGQALKVSIPHHLPAVKGDKERLRRVVTNLVSNAIKFTEEGGTITVTAQHDAARDQLLISVADTGRGVPPELRSELFNKFVRFQSQRFGDRESTGLGLYICKLIIEAHGGDIWLDGGERKGAVFTFSIPTVPNRTKEEQKVCS